MTRTAAGEKVSDSVMMQPTAAIAIYRLIGPLRLCDRRKHD